MNISIMNRVIEEANYIIHTKETVRQLAQKFNVSKSTIHKDLHERLKKYDKNLYDSVDKILKFHTFIRHIRGGESTKKKYAKIVP